MYWEVQVSWNERFKKVWTTPLLKLGKEISVSDAALSKGAALLTPSGSNPT